MIKTRIAFLIILISSISINLYSATVIKNKQSPTIERILETQDDRNKFEDVAEIVNYIDEIYGNLYDSLQNGGKVTLYFGPAHGKDDTGRW